ncbi:MAG: 30S ribosomal protein S3 [Candidatus Bathyarchaeum sp.]|nr:MAG: 30S ribosomal protein S3 [Candidatus Bathyarchaeum sp.]
MSVVKHFIEDSIKKAEIDEFLQHEFERAGYGGVSITKTPLGTHLVIYTMRPGLVIGRGGETIRALASILEEKFQLPSPQISVAEIEIPELNAYVVASRIASALKRGVHYRRAGFWGLTQAMQAGALGIEIIISGKLRTDRARYEKFREGYLPKSGEPPRKYMRKAELHVHLKPGTLGVKVRLIPPDAQFPDQVQVYIPEEEPEREPEQQLVQETAVTEEKTVEPEVSPAAETVETPASEPKVPVTEEKLEPAEKAVPVEKKVIVTKKVEEAKAPAAESKAVAEKKEVDAKVTSVEKKPVTEPKVEPKVVAEKKVVKAEPKSVAKKPAAEKKVAEPVAPVAEAKVVAEKNTVKSAVASVEPKVVPEEKVTEPKATPVKEKAKPTKKVAKKEAPSAKTNKEAGE